MSYIICINIAYSLFEDKPISKNINIVKKLFFNFIGKYIEECKIFRDMFLLKYFFIRKLYFHS
jgi:hypothetical protein